MKFKFRNKRISGIFAVVPQNERLFVEEMKNFNFPENRSLKLKEVMGYNKRRVVADNVCISDLAVRGLEHLFTSGFLKREDIDALVVITQTPDYFMPPTSNMIQGRLGLKRDMICLDISQGCAGFVIGLLQAFMLLEQECVGKVVMIAGDVLSRKASARDRNIYPLIGDAVAITVVERSSEDSVVLANVKMDGTRGEALIIPAGGMRMPCTSETAKLEDVGDNNFRAKDHLFMDGSAVFNFVQTEVPAMIEDLLKEAGLGKEAVDVFLCHQPNRFMLQKLADKMKVPHAKMPMNVVEHFGNSGGATIPMAIVLNLAQQLRTGHCNACLAGFGAGLTWSSMLLRLGGLDFCDILEYS